MEDQRFDDLTRLAARASRRRALKVLGTSALGGLLGFLGPRQATAQEGASNCCPDDRPRLCGYTCVDIASDPDNCGSCGNACHGSETCQDGECVKKNLAQSQCRGRTTDCNGTCVDLRTDPDNCGACGNVCASGECDRGVCVPGDECAENTDCGLCGVCTGGTCVPIAAGFVCRQAMSECDIAEACDGVSLDCPADVHEPDDTVCPGGTCQDGVCITSAFCGDGKCDPGETCENCPDDCGVCSGCEPGSTKECYSGPGGTAGVGACSSGIQTCQSDRIWGLCKGEVLPSAEVCNNLDDDCDGTTDNVDPSLLLDDPLNCGECFIECSGDQVCVNGSCED